MIGIRPVLAPSLVAASLAAAAACGGGTASSPSPVPAEPASARTAAELVPLCVRYYERERACVDEYLPALLDVRVEYDMPPGIKGEVERDGRDAALARMRSEWERDTTIENTDRICRAMETQVPPDQVERLLAENARCDAKPDCEGFVACTVEGQREYVRSGAAPH
jgi:hypothetical protein